MIREGGCSRHEENPATTMARDIFLDLCGFVADSGRDAGELELSFGSGTPAVGPPAVLIPCWRCDMSDQWRAHVIGWLRENKDRIVHASASTEEDALWEFTARGVVRLAFDPVSVLLLSLQLVPTLDRTLDSHGRDREDEDPLWRAELATFPYVNDLVAITETAADAALRSASEFLLAKPRWPRGVAWVMGISHDIDHLRKWRPENRELRIADVKRAIRNRQGIGRSLRSLLTSMIGPGLGWPDPFRNVAELTTLEAARRVRASYFFGIADPHASPFEISYAPDEIQRGIDFRALRELGHEVGLHASYSSAGAEGRLRAERGRLAAIAGGNIEGVRQHYLRFRAASTPGKQVRAGFLFDSSWGYPGRPGFRGGIASPFWIGRSEEGSQGLVELPMTAMDTSLREFLRSSFRDSTRILDELLTSAARVGGLAVLNWHNNAFDRELASGDDGVFRWTIDRARTLGATLMPLGEIADWWRYRSSIAYARYEEGIRFSHPEALRGTEFRVLGMAPDLSSATSQDVAVHVDGRGRTSWVVSAGGTQRSIRLR